MDVKYSDGDAAAKRREMHLQRKERAAEKLQSLLAEKQARRDEQMRALLSKRPGRPGRIGRRRGPGPLVAALRHEVQEALKLRQAAARCMALLAVEDRAARLDIAALERPQDRTWHADSLQMIDDGLSAAARELGADAPVALRTLRTALPQVAKLTAAVGKLNQALQGSEPSEEQIQDWSETVGALNQQVALAESAAEAIDGLSLEETPLGCAIVAAKESVLADVSSDLFAFKCLVMAAKADGEVTDAELGLLEDWARRLWLSPDEAAVLIERTRSVRRSDFQGDHAAAESIIRKMCGCIAIGGDVSPTEKALVEKIGAAIGVAEDTIKMIVAEVAPPARKAEAPTPTPMPKPTPKPKPATKSVPPPVPGTRVASPPPVPRR